MSTSRIYPGAPPRYEADVRRIVGADLDALHVAAQRLAWGMLLGEARTGVRLERESRLLLERHGHQLAAHVTVAHVRRLQGRDAEAAEHVARARELLTPEHPWAMLVGDAACWADPAPAALREEEPARVYRFAARQPMGGRALGSAGVATFVRVRGGELVYVNPVDLPDGIAQEVRALGEVTHVVAPARYHSDFVPQAQKQFPTAKTFGVPGHRGYQAVAHIRFDGYLDDDHPLFPGEIDQVTIHGVDVGDVWLVDRRSRTLLVTDALLAAVAPGWDAELRAPFAAFYAWVWGVTGSVGIPSYQAPMWNDLGAYQASLRRALALDFDHVASSHGPWRCVEGRGRAEIERAVGWLLDLRRLGSLALLGDFVRRHPGIFARLVRENVQTALARRRAPSRL